MPIRDFIIDDLPAIKRLHEQSGIDYEFPDLASPLFLVTKVLEEDGVVRAAGGMYLQVEAYLWLDHEWGDPEQRLGAIHELNTHCQMGSWLKGIDCCVLYLPPGMERFGERLKDMGFTKDRDGWTHFSRSTKL